MELNTAKLSSAVADGVRKENGYKLCLKKCRQVSGKIISTQKKNSAVLEPVAHRVRGIFTTEASM